VTVNGLPYAEHAAPLAQVGALLEAKAVHTSRSAYNHLRALAATHSIPSSRVDDVLDLVGLTGVARKRVGAFSLGMGQRLGIASALLADPQVVILDEPVNGLDPEGIRWVRGLLRDLAAEGRTVFLSSHLMSEMELTADHVIIVGRGRLIADVSIEDLRRSAGVDRIRVRSPHADRLRSVLAGPAVTISSTATDLLEVSGVSAEVIGQIAADQQLVLHELTPLRVSLEETFMSMTHDSVEYSAQRAGTTVAA
jgi:ABC-2 type transport system ATP-binding protein